MPRKYTKGTDTLLSQRCVSCFHILSQRVGMFQTKKSRVCGVCSSQRGKLIKDDKESILININKLKEKC